MITVPQLMDWLHAPVMRKHKRSWWRLVEIESGLTAVVCCPEGHKHLLIQDRWNKSLDRYEQIGVAEIAKGRRQPFVLFMCRPGCWWGSGKGLLLDGFPRESQK